MTVDAARDLAQATLPDGRALGVRLAEAGEAGLVVGLIHDAFRARPVIGAPPAALHDDAAVVAGVMARGAVYLATVAGEPVGVTLVRRAGDEARIGRVGVLPAVRRYGVASFLVGVVLEHLATAGVAYAHLLARKEYPLIEAWWERHGFARTGEEGDCWVLSRALPVVVEVPDADAMRALGRRLAPLLAPGDVVLASGDLGAGKTTLAQGIGEGLDVSGPIISPTFVLSRVHRPRSAGPAFVHVDAYRLDTFAELEDLDLEASLADAVTLVEWGTGVAEGLAADRLEVDIRRGVDPGDETRWVFLTPVGGRFDREHLAEAANKGVA